MLNLPILSIQVNECVDVPKEVCSIEKVNPRQVFRPIIKKWCSKDPELVAAMKARSAFAREVEKKAKQETTEKDEESSTLAPNLDTN